MQGTEELAMRWYQHFKNILNIPSMFRKEVIDNMPSLTLLMELDESLSIEELSEALMRLKNWKAEESLTFSLS